MATRRVVTRFDDLDGSGDAHTVRSGLDGQAYEIDSPTPTPTRSASSWPRTYRRAGPHQERPPLRSHRPRPASHHQAQTARTQAATVSKAAPPHAASNLNVIICRVEDVRSCR